MRRRLKGLYFPEILMPSMETARTKKVTTSATKEYYMEKKSKDETLKRL